MAFNSLPIIDPMAVVGMANRHIKIYKLDGQPTELSDVESPLKFQVRLMVNVFPLNPLSAPFRIDALLSSRTRKRISRLDMLLVQLKVRGALNVPSP